MDCRNCGIGKASLRDKGNTAWLSGDALYLKSGHSCLKPTKIRLTPLWSKKRPDRERGMKGGERITPKKKSPKEELVEVAGPRWGWHGVV